MPRWFGAQLLTTGFQMQSNKLQSCLKPGVKPSKLHQIWIWNFGLHFSCFVVLSRYRTCLMHITHHYTSRSYRRSCLICSTFEKSMFIEIYVKKRPTLSSCSSKNSSPFESTIIISNYTIYTTVSPMERLQPWRRYLGSSPPRGAVKAHVPQRWGSYVVHVGSTRTNDNSASTHQQVCLLTGGKRQMAPTFGSFQELERK